MCLYKIYIYKIQCHSNMNSNVEFEINVMCVPILCCWPPAHTDHMTPIIQSIHSRPHAPYLSFLASSLSSQHLFTLALTTT